MQLNRRDNMKCQRVIARSKVYVKFKRYLCQNHSRTKMVNSTFCKLLNFFSIFTNVFKEIKFKHKFPPLIKYSIYIYVSTRYMRFEYLRFQMPLVYSRSSIRFSRNERYRILR